MKRSSLYRIWYIPFMELRNSMPRITTSRDIPAQPLSEIKLENFKGIDLTSSFATVKTYRSPSALNMMPDKDGYPVKRTGYKLEHTYPDTIYAAHNYESASIGVGGEVVVIEKELIHSGINLYDGATLIYAGMAERESKSFQLDSKLWIVDGKRFLMYDGVTVSPVDQNAYVPMITIGRAPNGVGATSYRAINMLTPWVTDSFLGTEGTTAYVLSFTSLGSGAVEARILQANGTHTTITEGVGLSVNRTTGTVTFSSAPGKSPVDGQDNVEIKYQKSTDQKDKVNNCTFGILYGVNGALDRLFLSGNTAEPAFDYYSEYRDPTYFGDSWYSIIGQNAASIVGYSVLQDRLVTFKRNEEDDRNIFIRNSNIDNYGEVAFPISSVIQSEDTIGGIGSLGDEPLFLTKLGVHALTPQDMTGERVTQNRSYYINGTLLDEGELHKAKVLRFNRFFGISVNSKLYLLDGMQKTYERNEPLSAFQYECYLWDNIPATAIWERDGQLCFGTYDGKVNAFMDSADKNAYGDNVRENPEYIEGGDEPEFLADAIKGRWGTPLLNLDSWTNLKTVVNVWVVTQPYTRSGAVIQYGTDKEYEKPIKEVNTDIFSFADIDFSRFTFNTLNRPVITPTRKRAKKIKFFQVFVENDRLNEPFGVMAIVIRYRVGGKIRR